MSRSSLTGAWSGAYRYRWNVLPENVFNAQINETGASFIGVLQEPDQFRSGNVVTSEIEGVREGSNIRFIKFYDGSGGVGHSVTYEGSVDATLTRIEGKWKIPGNWSGSFFMTRDDESAAEEAAQSVELELLKLR